MNSVRPLLFIGTFPTDFSELGGGAWVDRKLLFLLEQDFLVTKVAVTAEVSNDRPERPSALSNLPLEVRHNRAKLARVALHMLRTGDPYLASKFRVWSGMWKDAANDLKKIAARHERVVTSGWLALLLCADAGVKINLHVAQNVESLIARRHAPRALRMLREEQRLSALEVDLLRRTDNVVTLSLLDADRLGILGIGASFLPLPLFSRRPIQNDTRRRLRVGFIGKASWPPNAAAIHSLMDDVVPSLRKADLDFEVVLAGLGTERWADHPVVGSSGYVASVEEFFSSIDVQVIPRDGVTTGVSVKLLEGTEFGVQAVVSPDVAKAYPGPAPWMLAENSHEAVDRLLCFAAGGQSEADSLAAYAEQICSVARKVWNPLISQLR